MPIYEYKCESGHLFDVMQRMSDSALTECIECGAPVRKVMQPIGISFKGSGFYSTDYNSAKTKETPASNTSNTSNTSNKSEGESSTSGDSSKESPNGSKSSGSSEKSGESSGSGAAKTPDKG